MFQNYIYIHKHEQSIWLSFKAARAVNTSYFCQYNCCSWLRWCGGFGGSNDKLEILGNNVYAVANVDYDVIVFGCGVVLVITLICWHNY